MEFFFGDRKEVRICYISNILMILTQGKEFKPLILIPGYHGYFLPVFSDHLLSLPSSLMRRNRVLVLSNQGVFNERLGIEVYHKTEIFPN
jgi:hypothetical protein